VSGVDGATVKAIVGAVWPAVAAAFGAWLGARVAFRRYKSERAFDRRIAWHERTCQLLQKIRWHFHSGAAFDLHGQLEAARQEYVKAFELADDFMAVIQDAELYGTQEAGDALNDLARKVNEFSDEMGALAKIDPRDGARIAHRIRLAQQHAVDLATTSKIVASTVRAELGLRPLVYPTFRPFTAEGQRRFEALASQSGSKTNAPGLTSDTPKSEDEARH
jgi:hypothetical protein